MREIVIDGCTVERLSQPKSYFEVPTREETPLQLWGVDPMKNCLAEVYLRSPIEKLILDLGCRNCRTTYDLATVAGKSRIVGLDNLPDVLKYGTVLQCVSRKVSFIEHDFIGEPLPLARDSVDLVVSFMLCSRLGPTDLNTVFRRINPILKPQIGRAVFLTFHPEVKNVSWLNGQDLIRETDCVHSQETYRDFGRSHSLDLIGADPLNIHRVNAERMFGGIRQEIPRSIPAYQILDFQSSRKY